MFRKLIAGFFAAILLLAGCAAPEKADVDPSAATDPSVASTQAAYARLAGHEGQLVRQTIEPLNDGFVSGHGQLRPLGSLPPVQSG